MLLTRLNNHYYMLENDPRMNPTISGWAHESANLAKVHYSNHDHLILESKNHYEYK